MSDMKDWILGRVAMAEEGGTSGEGGGGASEAGGGGGGGDGALTGGDSSEAAGATGVCGGGGDRGEEGGALNGGAAEAAAEVDYGKMTDDEYLGKVKLPEGQSWDKTVMSKFAPLLRENKIAPEVFQKFVELDSSLSKAAAEENDRKLAEQNKAAVEAFREAGKEFHREFTPEQTKEMNDTLSKIDDETFVTLVTKSPLSNNKTMGKMLLAYKKVFGGEDTVPQGGGAGGADRGFAEVWTGRKA